MFTDQVFTVGACAININSPNTIFKLMVTEIQ